MSGPHGFQVVDEEMLRANPFLWFERYLTGPTGYLTRSGVDSNTASASQIATALRPMFSNQSAENIANMIVGQWREWRIQVENALRLNLSPEARQISSEGSLLHGLVSLQSSLQDVLGALSENFKMLLPILNSVTDALKAMARWLDPRIGNPILTMGVTLAVLFRGGFLLLRMLGALSPFLRTLIGGGAGLLLGGFPGAITGAMMAHQAGGWMAARQAGASALGAAVTGAAGAGGAAAAATWGSRFVGALRGFWTRLAGGAAFIFGNMFSLSGLRTLATAGGQLIGRLIVGGIRLIFGGPWWFLASIGAGLLQQIYQNWDTIKDRVKAIWADLANAAPTWLGGGGQGLSAITSGQGISQTWTDLTSSWLFDNPFTRLVNWATLHTWARERQAELERQASGTPTATVTPTGGQSSVQTGPISISVSVAPTNASPQAIASAIGLELSRALADVPVG